MGKVKLAYTVGDLKSFLSKKHVTKREFATRSGLSEMAFQNYAGPKIKQLDKIISHEGVKQALHEYLLEYGYENTISKVVNKVPHYSLDAYAGSSDLVADFDQIPVEDYVDVPEMREVDFFFNVKGDSMEPDYRSGGKAAAKQIDKDVIVYGKAYLIFFEGEMPHPPIMKYIRRTKTPNKTVTLHSLNTKYDDFDIPRSKIKALFVIRGNINHQI